MLRHDNTEHTTHRITDRTSGASASPFGANHPSRGMARRGGQDDASGSSLYSQNTSNRRLLETVTRRVTEPVPGGTGKGPGTGPLGIYPKSLDQLSETEKRKEKENKRLESRRQLYSDLKKTSLILLEAMPNKVHAVAKCRWTKVAGFVTLNLVDVGDGQRRSSFKGVKICGNVWGCPVCAARISQKRRGEMNDLLAWGREKSLIPVMLTLTARHGRGDRLADLLQGMKKRRRRGFVSGKEWRRLPVVGTVTATEVTHGTRNGWHPHFHEIVLIKASNEAEALAMVAPLGDAWRASCEGRGWTGTRLHLTHRGPVQPVIMSRNGAWPKSPSQAQEGQGREERQGTFAP